MMADLLLIREQSPLPESYAPAGRVAGWVVGVRGQPRIASSPHTKVLVCGDPIVRSARHDDVAAAFLEAAERGNAETFLREQLFGSYVVCEISRDSIRLFNSASGLLHLFHSPIAASTSLRSLAAVGAWEFDPIAVYQFLCAGYTFGRRTVFRDVERLMGGEGIATRGDRLERSRWKPLTIERGRLSASALAEHIRASIAPCRDGLLRGGVPYADVTGGFDTRLVVALLHDIDVPFRGWVSGSGTDRDVQLAFEIGDRLGVTVESVDVAGHTEELTQFVLDHFERQDCLKTLQSWLDMMFANMQLAGSDILRVSGHGGEQFRDFSWQQEFPFYGLRRRPNVDLQIRLRFMATHVDPTLFAPGDAATLRDEQHRALAHDMRAFVEEIQPPDNLSACVALYLGFRELSRMGSSSSEKRRFFPNWAPLLEPELWLQSVRTSWVSRLGAGLSLELAERFAPELRGLPTAALGRPARGLAAGFQTAAHYGRRATAKLFQKVRNRPYASARARSLHVMCNLLRRPEMREMVMAASGPCHLDPSRVEAMLEHPEAPGSSDLLGALLPLGKLAQERRAALPT